MNNLHKFTLLIFFCFLKSCNIQPKNKITEFDVSNESFRGEKFIDLRISENSYERLFSEFVEKKRIGNVSKRTQKNYYFDFFVDEGPEGLLLRTNGLVLSVQLAQQGFGKIHLKINRMLREPQNSSIYSRFDYSCKLKHADTLKKILDGVMPILSVAEQDCYKSDSIRHPIEVAKEVLESDVLGMRGVPKRIPLASIKPIATNRVTAYEVYGKMYDANIPIYLEKTIYPRGVLGYRLFVNLSGEEKSKKFHRVFNYLQQNGLSYTRNFFQTEDLTFLISYAEETEYESLFKSGYLARNLGRTKS